MTRSRLLSLILAFPLAWMSAVPVYGQSIWLPRDKDRALLLEALHPSIEESDPDFPTGAAFLGARVRVGPWAALVVELPYARFEGVFTENFWFSFATSSNTAGNPYIGVELQPEGSDFFAELGVRVPLADDDEWQGTSTGMYADRTRFDAFVRDNFAVHTVFNVRHVSPSGLLTRLRLGPVLTLDNEDGDAVLYAVFAWQIGYEGAVFRVGGAMSGTTNLSQDYLNLGYRTMTQAELHADFGDWKVRPGFDVKLPIGIEGGRVPVVIGLSVGAAF